jgi:cytochrome c-type biogenesis protein CcmH
VARLVLALWLCLSSLGAAANGADNDAAIEARMLHIAAQLRCLVCQNQTLADSNAGLAEDLREQLRVMLRHGDSDEQIQRYMTERYGDFVLYRPPLKAATLLLWFGPALLLGLGLGTLVLVLRRRARMGDERFEPDAGDDEVPP